MVTIHSFTTSTTDVIHNPIGAHEYRVYGAVSVVLYIFFYDILASNTSTETTLTVECLSSDAAITLSIIHVQRGNHILRLTTVQHHTVSSTRSQVVLKGVVYDTAQLIYKGTIVINKEADTTVALQKSHTLLLSDKAGVQTTPSLEVLAKHVQCKHGSAIARCDATMMDYLNSRGLSRGDAEMLMVESFLLSIVHDTKARLCIDGILKKNLAQKSLVI